MLNFEVSHLNSPFDDSAFFVRNVYLTSPFLLDCGRLSTLRQADLLSVADIFVSHTHIDHFFGFDRVIRGCHAAEQKIRVYGPKGIIANVHGKLAGYTWNLVEAYGFELTVFELGEEGGVKTAYFRAKNRFAPEYGEEFEAGGALPLEDGFTIKYAFFDHRTPSVGYRVEEPLRYNVDKEKLDSLGYLPGPWLGKLKEAVILGDLEREVKSKTADGEGRVKRAGEFKEEFINLTLPQSLTYITDCAPTEANVELATRFAGNSTLLIIEAMFLREDGTQAARKCHLPVHKAKEIFLASSSRMVRFTHFSSRYEQEKRRFFEELYKGVEGRVLK